MKVKLLLLLFFIGSKTLTFNGYSQIEYVDENVSLNISSKFLIYEDKTRKLTIDSIKIKKFKCPEHQVSNFGVSEFVFWLKIPITNNSNSPELLMEISHPILDYLELYSPVNGSYVIDEYGEDFIFSKRKYNDPNYIFDLYIEKGKSKIFYLKIKSDEAIQLPIKLGSKNIIINEIKYRDLISGIYLGIMLVMIIYNLFLYFSVRDRSYIYYVIYILAILITQIAVQGYSFQFLWPNYPSVAKMSLIILPSLAGITGLLFMNVFLKVKEFHRLYFKISFLFFIPYFISIILSILSYYKVGYTFVEINAAVVSFFMLFVSIKIVRIGYHPAKYFLIAWVVFLLGVIIFILKDLDVLPFNNFTRYTMQIGSAIETVLLSFALASKINIYKKESLDALQETQDVITEQNITLEHKVEERTRELNTTLTNLKNTQSQLVEAEKMSSLGQLTAGIAHEINNPINFVSSNIYPLRQDIADIKKVIKKYETIKNGDNIEAQLIEIENLKKELDFDYLNEELETIINGIEEGAERTSTIVRGLRTFSRLDEGALKDVNINEGIEATLILINNKLGKIKIEKELGNIPTIECNPGQLNQLFMNVIDNAIFAVQKRNIENGIVKIKTEKLPSGNIKFTIEDNGIGIPLTVLEKMFDPFFTTKKIGEGTGLGLSIVKSIVDDHKGIINVDSTLNNGTKIEVELPQKKKNNE